MKKKDQGSGKICPECGSRNIHRHCEGTFQYRGFICLECGHEFPGPVEEQLTIDGSRPLMEIRIKSWRKAWNE